MKGKKCLRAAEVCVALLVTLAGLPSAHAEVKLAEGGGWGISLDGRVNAFISVAEGTGIPDGQPDFPGTITKDTKDSAGNIASTRVRNGFMMSILGFNAQKQVSEDLKVSARIALWLNTSSSRTKNVPGPVDPRELYGRLEGSWGASRGEATWRCSVAGGFGSTPTSLMT